MQKNKKMLLVFRIVIVVSFIFVVTSSIIYFMEIGKENKSYFSSHFALPVILFLVGVIAIMVSTMSKQNLSGESKGDNIMVGVGFLLFLCSILTLIFSYVQ